MRKLTLLIFGLLAILGDTYQAQGYSAPLIVRGREAHSRGAPEGRVGGCFVSRKSVVLRAAGEIRAHGSLATQQL